MAITKRENGTWRLSIYRIGLPRIRKTFRTREEARKYQKIFQGELEKGNHEVLDTFNKVLKGEISKEEPKANKISFEEYLRGWHSTREKSEGFRINTLRRIEQQLRGYIYPILGSYKLSEINSDKLYTLRDKMYKKGLSKQTVKNCFATIKTSLNDAAKKRLLPFYPLADLINIKLKDGDSKKVMPLSYQEQEQLLKIAIDYSNKQNDQRRFMLYYMLVNTGIRYGELCGLKWKDINLDKKTLKIERQCIFPEGNTNPILADLKTDSSKREIELTNDDVKEIKQYKIWASEYLTLPMAKSPFIQNLDGSHIYKDFGRSTFRTFLKLAGLPHFPIHSLRHTHASNLANTSIPIKKLSNRLGHSDISTTMNVYSHAHVGDDSSYLEKANVRRA